MEQQPQQLRYSKRTLKRLLDIKSDTTVQQLVKRGDLPPPIKETERGPCYWLAADVTRYLESLAAKRVQNAA